ncbi:MULTISPECIES: phage tail assembly protein [unclassified Methylococcus]|uniref:phage tail assembly protein n=1 Tax=unclassified Methylococcus TaxID=2618889 RepID=UPI003D7EDE98
MQIISLREPLKTGDGRTLTELTMRVPKVKDLKAAQRFGGSDADVEVALIASLVGVVPEDLDELGLADYRRLQDSFRRFSDPAGGAVEGDGAAGTVVPVPAQ